MSLYEKLGVEKDASHEEIKRKFRDLSKEHHPDKGGDEEVFKELVACYEILGNKKRRQNYDETGETDYTTKQDRPTELLIEVFMGIIESHGPDCEIMVELKSKLNSLISRNKNTIKGMEKDIKEGEKIKKRLKWKGSGNGLLFALIENRIISIERSIENSRQAIKDFSAAYVMAEEYEYDYEIPISDMNLDVPDFFRNPQYGGIFK